MTRAFLRCTIIAFAASALAPTVFTAASLLHRRQTVPLGSTLVAVAVVVGASWLFYLLLRRFEAAVDANARDQVAFLDTLPLRYVDLAIAGAAGLSLFLELAVIRWQGTVFEFFAFYKNFGLLACFAGLGLGYALASRDRIYLALAIPLLVWQFGLLIGLRFGLEPWQLESVTAIPFLEQLSMGARSARTVAQWLAVYFFLSLVFLLTALAFVPIGQLCGRLMARRPHLRAYGLNLLGSLAGVLLTLLAGALWTSPVVWFGVACLAILLFAVPRPTTLLPGFAAAITGVVILAWPVQPSWQRIYSPYQLLELGYSDAGLMVIRAAGHYYQRVHDLSSPRAADDSVRRRVRDYYDLPYRVRPAPADVAVVGAGAGNDVAAALRGGAAHIDAIEIDPAILWAGRANHPERPYTNARVLPIANDARSYLRTTDRTYDMIVYGLLDSHTLLSHASSVRLDSFVYTVEGFREARARLKPGGILVVSFSALTEAIGRKMYEMLRQAFDGAAPAVVSAGYDGAVVFLQTKEGTFALPPGAIGETGLQDQTARYRGGESTARVDVSTDDWPFFYMPRRVYPVSYLLMLGMVLLGSLFLTRTLVAERPQLGELPFAFLGAGFMLVETKAITELGLTFGNTWQVIGIVIAGVLIMAFLANAAVHRFDLRRPHAAYALLLVSLAVGWFVARGGGFPPTTAGRIASAAILTSPLFFSGIVFSTLLGTRGSIAAVMAANLLGAMAGGLLEYNSMYFGFRFLYLLAMALYAIAWAQTIVGRRAAPS